MYGRTFAPGGAVAALYLQFSSGREHVPSEVAPAIAAAGPGISQVEVGGVTYQVQSVPLDDPDADPRGTTPFARVVMARPLGGVLSGLFPAARSVFVIALLAALALAGGRWLRGRRLATRVRRSRRR